MLQIILITGNGFYVLYIPWILNTSNLEITNVLWQGPHGYFFGKNLAIATY